MEFSDLKSKKILITGGLGFIGSNLAHRCVSLGAEVSIYDVLDPKLGGNSHNIFGIENAVRISINNIGNLEPLCSAVLGQDIIFHCAGSTSHPDSMTDPLTDIDVNCKGSINLLEALRRFNPEAKVVFLGTSTQIGRMASRIADERHPEFPLDIYSANKAAAENYFHIYGNAYGMRTSVVRLVNTYGPRSCIRSSKFGFFNFFIGLGLSKKEITVFGDGTQVRSICFVDDAVEALIAAALSSKADNEVFFAGSDRQYSVAEIARKVVDHIGGEVKFVPWPKNRRMIEFGDAIISSEKIKATLGWEAKTPLEEGLQKTNNYFQLHLSKYL